MAYITGVDADHFADRKIQVRVGLLRTGPGGTENTGKLSPKLLTDATRKDGLGYIGNVVVCEADSHIIFQISTNKAICGIRPFIKTAQETIWHDKYTTSHTRYDNINAWIQGYSDSDRTIKVSDWGTWSREETMLRQNVEISVLEVTSFTQDGVNYPTAGSDADVAPGGLGSGTDAGLKFGSISDAQVGEEIGAVPMHFFVLKGPQAVQDFYQSLKGVDPNAQW
jgi:hypothetical protein